MNVFAKFDKIPSMTLKDIKETKRYGHTFGRSFGRTDVKTVYPPANCGGDINQSKEASKTLEILGIETTMILLSR